MENDLSSIPFLWRLLCVLLPLLLFRLCMCRLSASVSVCGWAKTVFQRRAGLISVGGRPRQPRTQLKTNRIAINNTQTMVVRAHSAMQHRHATHTHASTGTGTGTGTGSASLSIAAHPVAGGSGGSTDEDDSAPFTATRDQEYQLHDDDDDEEEDDTMRIGGNHTNDEAESVPLTSISGVSSSPSSPLSPSSIGGGHSSSSAAAAAPSWIDHLAHAIAPPGLQQAIREHEHTSESGLPLRISPLDGSYGENRRCCFFTFPRTNSGRILLGICLLGIFLFLDAFIISKPYGLLNLHTLLGQVRYSSSGQSCGWDYEASWKIGLIDGSTPWVPQVKDKTQPTLSCATITHLPASFVADPFLVIPSNTWVAEGSQSVPPQPWLKAGSTCDMSLAEPVSAKNTGTHASDFAGIPGSVGSCYSLPPGEHVRGDTRNNKDPWYIFYELKNLNNGAGELGASVSKNHGASWTSVGTVLRETMPGSNGAKPLHLSYPQVFPSSNADGRIEWLMIPETSFAGEVRIYRTDSCCFPFGWSLATVKLTGQRYVDTTVIWVEDRWYIFTSVEYTLHLYMTSGPKQSSLIDGTWVTHPSSPLYTTSRLFGRSAGRILTWQGSYWRPSQDCSGFYGEKVHVHRIDELTPTSYRESWSHDLKPSRSVVTPGSVGKPGFSGTTQAGVVDAAWAKNRVHHIDMAYIPAHQGTGSSSGLVAGRWVGVIDADDIPDDYWFYQREGWFWWTKAIIAVTVVIVAVYGLWRRYILHLYLLRPMYRIVSNVSTKVQSSQRWLMIRINGLRGGTSSNIGHGSIWFTIGYGFVMMIVSMGIAFLLTNGYPWNMTCVIGCGSHGGNELPVLGSMDQLARQSQAYVQAYVNQAGEKANSDATGMVTHVDQIGRPWTPRPMPFQRAAPGENAATPQAHVLIGSDELTFELTLNLISSIQFWWTTFPERTVGPNFIIYDLGLTSEQAHQIRCIPNVAIHRLPYASLPAHVRLTESGAWKAYALDATLALDTIHSNDAVLLLDPSKEVIGSLSDLFTELWHRGSYLPVLDGPTDSRWMSEATTSRTSSHPNSKQGLTDMVTNTSPHMFAHLELETRLFLERSLCDSGIFGLIKTPLETESIMVQILPILLECSANLDCIYPPSIPSASYLRHATSDSLFTLAYAKLGLTCQDSERLRKIDGLEQQVDQTLPLFLTKYKLDESRVYEKSLHKSQVRTIPPSVPNLVAMLTSESIGRYRSRLNQDEECLADLSTSSSSPSSSSTTTQSSKSVSDWTLPIGASSHSSDALWSCVRKATETDDIGKLCLRELESSRNDIKHVLESSTKYDGTFSEPTFFVQLRQRFECLPFWTFFCITMLLTLSATIRQTLVRTKKRIGLVVFVLLFLFVWIPLYQLALIRWGTFAPWNAIWYTTAYKRPPIPIHNDQLRDVASKIKLDVDVMHASEPAYSVSQGARSLPFPPDASQLSSSDLFNGPPPSWRPSQRVVVSFTTMPHHVDKLAETIDSLLAQTLLPDAIYLNLPRGRNKRTNQTYEVLPYLIEKYSKTVFRINRCEDVGPLTKLVPTLDVEPDPETIVITVDSDKTYHPHTIATLAWRSVQDPRAAFGLCGWGFYWQPPPMLVTPVYAPWLTRGNEGRSVDVLQAVCGNAYRRAFFGDLTLLRRPHPKCFTTDDLWIAGYLATRAHIKRVIINTPGAYSTAWGSIEPVSTSWKGDDPAQWQLSTNNVKPGVDMACIRGVEERLGPWRQIRHTETRTEATYDQPEQGE